MGKNEVVNFRRRRKDNLIKLHGGECSLCGYNKCNAALEFHHINPEEKSFQISSGNCHKIEDDIAESKKCLLVCSNCHREIHENLHEKDGDLFQYQHIDTDFEQELLKLNKQEQRFCFECGNPITLYSKSGLCASCVQLKKYKGDIPKPTREELKELIRTLPFTQIAEKYNVSDNAVRKWCDKANLPRTKKTIEKYTDEQWSKI